MPLPRLDSDDFTWYGKATLPAWSGFQDRAGAYESRTSSAPSTSQYHLMVEFPEETRGTPPSDEQHRAYDYLLEHQGAIREALLPLLFAEYQLSTAEFTAKDKLDYGIPEITSPDELSARMGLSGIHISDISKDGVAYMGLSFGCDWDEEHGVGAMLHQSRIIDVGDASISFERGIAWKDKEGYTYQPPEPPTRLPVEPEDDGQKSFSFE